MSFLAARKRAGLTQVQVADRIGVDPSAVSYWESGRYLPSTKVLIKVAELYGVTTDELLRAEPTTES